MKSKDFGRGDVADDFGSPIRLPPAIELIDKEGERAMSAEDKNFILDMLVAWTLEDLKNNGG